MAFASPCKPHLNYALVVVTPQRRGIKCVEYRCRQNRCIRKLIPLRNQCQLRNLAAVTTVQETLQSLPESGIMQPFWGLQPPHFCGHLRPCYSRPMSQILLSSILLLLISVTLKGKSRVLAELNNRLKRGEIDAASRLNSLNHCYTVFGKIDWKSFQSTNCCLSRTSGNIWC